MKKRAIRRSYSKRLKKDLLLKAEHKIVSRLFIKIARAINPEIGFNFILENWYNKINLRKVLRNEGKNIYKCKCSWCRSNKQFQYIKELKRLEQDYNEWLKYE